MAECFQSGTATFLILGMSAPATAFTAIIVHGVPRRPDAGRTETLWSAAIGHLGLSHVVITSVTRDDLPDGGAAHFAACLRHDQNVIGRTAGSRS